MAKQTFGVSSLLSPSCFALYLDNISFAYFAILKYLKILFGTIRLLCSLVDRKGQGQSNEPIVTLNGYIQPTQSAGKRSRANHNYALCSYFLIGC